MEELNLNMPDDDHCGMMTPGVLDEDFQSYTMSKISFEYIASELIRSLNIKRMTIDKVIRDNNISFPDEMENKKAFNKAYAKFLKDFSKVIKEERETMMTMLESFFEELWDKVSVNPYIKTWVGDDIFRILYNNEITDSETDFHSFEIIGFFLEESNEFYHARLIWNDTGVSFLE